MSIEYTTLNEAFPDGLSGGGLFSEMINPPWVGTYSASDLDLLFFLEHGNKPISPVVNHFTTDLGVIEADRIKIASLVMARFGDRWTHKNALLSLVYNPIENYNMGEDEQTNTTENDDTTTTANKSTDFDSTSTIDRDSTTNTVNDVYGFNSTTAVPSDVGNGANTIDGTDIVDQTELAVETVVIDNAKIVADNRALTRKGNIGVTTTQQMIQQELDLRKWDFMNDIFNDVSSLLALTIY